MKSHASLRNPSGAGITAFWTSRLATVIAIGCLSLPCATQAANLVFQVPTGSWNDAANWTGMMGVPDADDLAVIRGGRTATVDSEAPAVAQVTVGEAAGSTVTVVVTTNGSLTVNGNLQLMRQGNFANTIALLTMTGGSLTVGATNGTLLVGVGTPGVNGNDVGSGTVNISGGTLMGAMTIGSLVENDGLGYFNITGSLASIQGGAANKNLLLNPFGTLAYTFDATGVSALNYGTSAVTLAAGSTINVNGSDYTGPGGDIFLINGSTLSVNPLLINTSLTGFTNWTPTLVYNEGGNGDVILRLTAVPEPSITSLLLAGLWLCLIRRRKRAA